MPPLTRKDFTSQAAYEAYLTEQGLCPECGRKVKGYTPPFGSFAPEMWETIREMGVDPATNHLKTCSRPYRLGRF